MVDSGTKAACIHPTGNALCNATTSLVEWMERCAIHHIRSPPSRARGGRNRFRRLADGCDPAAGCKAPDIRMLLCAFTVASRKRVPAPRSGALPPSRGKESLGRMKRSAIHQTRLQARNDGFLEVPYNKNAEPNPRSQPVESACHRAFSGEEPEGRTSALVLAESVAYCTGCLG